jgi:bisanhydrobacterioruberin hydratase
MEKGKGKNRFVNLLKEVYSHKKIIIFILASFYAMGILWHALPLTYPLMLIVTPSVLLVFGLFIFGAGLLEGGKLFLGWSVVTFLATFAVEAAGVATGSIFGEYYYGDVLGAKILGVPLVIGFNWTIVVFGIASFVGRFISNRVLAAFLTACGGVVFDWLMEPIAMALGYWEWIGNSVPFQNYLAWFIIGFGAGLGFFAFNLRIKSNYPPIYVLIQALFFIGLRFVVV